MEITWYGLSCFKLAERGAATVVTDPYNGSLTGFKPLRLNANIVTVSHEAPGHNHLEAVIGSPYVINGPGEYEVGGVFITGIHPLHTKGGSEQANTLYLFHFETLSVVHLGDINYVPAQSEIEAIGNVDVALVPVGSGKSLNAARAAEVISLIEPSIVIPMHYATPECTIPLDPLSKFLKEMGISEVVKQPSLKVTNTSLPEETQVVVLDYHGG